MALLTPSTFWSNTLSVVSPKEQGLPSAWKKCCFASEDESVEKQGAVLGLGHCRQPRHGQVPSRCPGRAQGWQPGRTGGSELSSISPGTTTWRSFTSGGTKCFGTLGRDGGTLLRALAVFCVLRRFCQIPCVSNALSLLLEVLLAQPELFQSKVTAEVICSLNF